MNKRQLKWIVSMRCNNLKNQNYTFALQGATWKARKAILYVRSRTPNAFKPPTPSLSSEPLTRDEVSALVPIDDSLDTSGTTMSVPMKSHRSPAWVFSTHSALKITSKLLGMQPRGNSDWISCMRTFWKSTNFELFKSSWNRCRLEHCGFLHEEG